MTKRRKVQDLASLVQQSKIQLFAEFQLLRQRQTLPPDLREIETVDVKPHQMLLLTEELTNRTMQTNHLSPPFTKIYKQFRVFSFSIAMNTIHIVTKNTVGTTFVDGATFLQQPSNLGNRTEFAVEHLLEKSTHHFPHLAKKLKLDEFQAISFLYLYLREHGPEKFVFNKIVVNFIPRFRTSTKTIVNDTSA